MSINVNRIWKISVKCDLFVQIVYLVYTFELYFSLFFRSSIIYYPIKAFYYYKFCFFHSELIIYISFERFVA